MKKMKALLRDYIKKLRDGPPKPPDIGNCVHCGRPFERLSIGSGEPVIECRHKNGLTEYLMRYPNTWRVTIIRQYTDGRPASKAYLELCEFCFLMKPRFVGIRIERPCIIFYVWETERSERYERYDYGSDKPCPNQNH